MLKKSRIGEYFNCINIVVTDEDHESGYKMLDVSGYKISEDKTYYLGEHDVVNIEQENGPGLSIDSIKAGSEFEIRTMDDMFKLVWNSDSIRFKSIKFNEGD